MPEALHLKKVKNFCPCLAWVLTCCNIYRCMGTYTYTCGNIVNTIMTNGHTSLEKYTSHTLFEMVAKGLCVRGELETEQNCNILTPSTSGYSSTFFSWAARSPGLFNRGPWGPQALSLELVLMLASYLQNSDSNSKLTRTSCATGLYNYLASTCFSERRICTQFNPSTVKVIPWNLRPDAPVICTGAFLIWQLGRVGGQYVTLRYAIFWLGGLSDK